MKIVSLLASATEILAQLGCLTQIVGRSHECDYPPEVLALPLVSTVQIDIDSSSAQIDAQIKALAHSPENTHDLALRALSIYTLNTILLEELQPDIIFTQTQCEVCAVSERDVRAALAHSIGIEPAIVSLSPYRLQDVWEDIIRVGKAVGKTQEAQALVTTYQQRLHQLHSETKKLSLQRNSYQPRVALLEWLDPLMVAGNWTPELITYAGGISAFGTPGMHSSIISWDKLQQADPDIIILCPCGFTLERTMQDVPLLVQHPVWSKLRAVQNQRVYALDGNAYVNRSGPRLVESTELIAHLCWGNNLNVEQIDKTDQAWIQV